MFEEQRKQASMRIRILRRMQSVFRNIEKRLRYTWLNNQPGIRISNQALVAPSVKFELEPESIYYGGKVTIAADCRIANGVILTPYGGSISIGNNVFIGPYCVLYGHGGIVIGSNTFIAGHTFIVASNHNFSDPNKLIAEQSTTNLGISIGEDVWIGCGVRILDGVTIGTGCVIGAGAVVNKSLPDYSVAVGVPAKVISSRSSQLDSA